MRNLSRMTIVLAFAAALLLALPAHASPPQRSHAAPATSSQAISAWLGSLWTDLARLFNPDSTQGQPTGQGKPLGGTHQRVPVTRDLGSCIDPDGSLSCLPY